MKAIAAVLITAALAVTGLLGPAPAQAAQAPSAPSHAREGSAPYQVKPFKPRASDNDRLVRAWRTWQRRTDHRQYYTEVDQSCFCPPRRPIMTNVIGKRVDLVFRKGRAGKPLEQRGYEMPRLYRILRDGYRSADAVKVRYRAGVPVSIYIDYDEMVADEELVLSVRVHTPVE